MGNLTCVYFGTSNINKYKEIKTIFNHTTSIQVKHALVSPVEIQSNDLEEIASNSLKTCTKEYKTRPFFVEDSGLFIKCLAGFPGPYSAYTFETIGNEGILRLLEREKNREAYFQSSIALTLEAEILIFSAVVEGQISKKVSHSGWGYDPIFIPNSNRPSTFGDLGDEKRWVSHRFFATRKMITYLEKSF